LGLPGDIQVKQWPFRAVFSSAVRDARHLYSLPRSMASGRIIFATFWPLAAADLSAKSRSQRRFPVVNKDAEIEIERARGVAEANSIINDSLTAQYLQHEINMALQSFAENEGQLVAMPANMQGFDIILDTQRFPGSSNKQ